MSNDLVFRTGLGKQTLGWLVFTGAAFGLAAVIYGILTHPESQIPSELWSAAAIGVFLIGLMVYGVAVQYTRWSIEGDNIVFRRLFKNKIIPISGLAGFGQFIFVFNLIPFNHLDLYDRDLKILARLPVSFKDWPRAEAWFAERFRYVVNDGSAALPKRRFADTPKA